MSIINEKKLLSHVNLIGKMSDKMKVEPNIIAAFCSIESHFNTWAIKYEPHYIYLLGDDPWENVGMMAKLLKRVDKKTEFKAQQFSFGLMQVMGGVARELGYKSKYLTGLCNSTEGIRYGCLHFHNKLSRYSGDLQKAVAAYNAGSAIYDDQGSFVNQKYVDGFFEHLTLIRNMELWSNWDAMHGRHTV